MKSRWYFLLIGALLLCSSVTAASQTYVVKTSDYRGLRHIANTLGVDFDEFAKLNNLKAPYIIHPKQVLKVPTKEDEKVVLDSGTRRWKRISGDPILSGKSLRRWVNNPYVSVRHKALLRSWGFTPVQIRSIDIDLKVGNCREVIRPAGFTWERMGFGKGAWTKTQNATGKVVEVWSCDSVAGYTVDIAMGCSNVAINAAEVPEKPVMTEPPPPPIEEVTAGPELRCAPKGTVWGAGHFGTVKGYAASVELSCQLVVGPGLTAGPLFRASKGHFASNGWKEDVGFVGGGIRLRATNPDLIGSWLDEVKIDLAIGQGRAKGHSTREPVRKPSIKGLDLWISAQFTQSGIEIDGYTFATMEIMPFAQIPLTGKSGPITWNGQNVDRAKRHAVVGVIGRMGFESEGQDYVPEITVGGWHAIGQDDDPTGGKVLVGVAAKDRSWRIGAGVEFPNVHPIVEGELNFGAAALTQSAEDSETALTDGASSTCTYLGIDCPEGVDETTASTVSADMDQSSNSDGSHGDDESGFLSWLNSGTNTFLEENHS
jgi:LysM repeat protein